jgi:hypothetical protein
MKKWARLAEPLEDITWKEGNSEEIGKKILPLFILPFFLSLPPWPLSKHTQVKCHLQRIPSTPRLIRLVFE